MADKFDFTAWTAAKLKRDVEFVDMCIRRFASWACGWLASPCALCVEYHGAEKGCLGCPIALDGHQNCNGTPFDVAAMRGRDATMEMGGGHQPAWLTPNYCAAEIRYLLRLRGKLSKALREKAAAKKAAKAKAARKRAAARK